MRNPTDEVVSVTGVAADEDRDGAFVPERGRRRTGPGAGRRWGEVEVEGTVKGCDYGGAAVPLAGPELRKLESDGEQFTRGDSTSASRSAHGQGC